MNTFFFFLRQNKRMKAARQKRVQEQQSKSPEELWQVLTFFILFYYYLQLVIEKTFNSIILKAYLLCSVSLRPHLCILGSKKHVTFATFPHGVHAALVSSSRAPKMERFRNPAGPVLVIKRF